MCNLGCTTHAKVAVEIKQEKYVGKPEKSAEMDV